jgi:hypothetical protein
VELDLGAAERRMAFGVLFSQLIQPPVHHVHFERLGGH